MLALTPPEMLAWRGFLHAHATLWTALETELQKDGLNLAAYELLTNVQDAGEMGIRMTDLAQKLRFSGGGLTRLADRLQHARLIQRQRSETDGRGWQVTLTPEGQRHLKRVDAKHLREVRTHFLDKLSAEEIEMLGRIWQKLESN